MKLRPLTASLLILCLLSSCAPAAENTATFLAMDTVMSVTVYGPDGDAALEAVEEEIKVLEGLLSVTDKGSEIYAANHSGGKPVTLSPETAELLSTALGLCAETVGALDVTIYPVVRAWGFTTEEYRVPEEAELTRLLEQVDYTRVELEGNSLTVPEGWSWTWARWARAMPPTGSRPFCGSWAWTAPSWSWGEHPPHWHKAGRDPLAGGGAGPLWGGLYGRSGDRRRRGGHFRGL